MYRVPGHPDNRDHKLPQLVESNLLLPPRNGAVTVARISCDSTAEGWGAGLCWCMQKVQEERSARGKQQGLLRRAAAPEI